jgi:hypothetical protein
MASTMSYATLPAGDGSWDTGAATTLTITRALTVSGALVGSTSLTITGTSTLTGDVAVVATTSDRQLAIRASAGQNRTLRFQTGTSDRWYFNVNSTAEAGSDAGSDFSLTARTDAGGAIDNPIFIARAAGGAITLARRLVTPATTTTRAFLNLPHGTAPSSPVNGDIWTTTAGLFVQINGVTKTVTLT